MIVSKQKTAQAIKLDLQYITLTRDAILADYHLAFQSRQASLLGRREVMSGKAKFGIFGDGKELAQIAMAKAFRKGDFRSGYYRDQTFMFAVGMSNIREFFAQLYAHADLAADPASAGRAMNCHFGTRSLDEEGNWQNLTEMFNSAADVSPTGSQMPRLVGLAYASRLYREIDALKAFTQFSKNGQEVAFGTIGNASCAEGMFWESVNAIGVLKAPAVISIWDDGYGISVSNEHQVTKQNISELLTGFQRNSTSNEGFDLYTVNGWDYPALVETYLKAVERTRMEHVPCIIHVMEVTQPQGHSTSGSHERYKPKERLRWELEFDCIKKMREWMIAEGIANGEELNELEKQDAALVKKIRDQAWEAFQAPIHKEKATLLALIEELTDGSSNSKSLLSVKNKLKSKSSLFRKDIMMSLRETLFSVKNDATAAKQKLLDWKAQQEAVNRQRFGSHLYSESAESPLKVPEVKPVYSERSPIMNGFELLNVFFDKALTRDPRVIAFGEDVGQLGGVNQGFRDLQNRYGSLRVSDTGIRECTILGQAIGMAMRGLKPIAEIQYLDYLLYALQIMSDDLATLHWRTRGGQKAPVIVRTRGHRLEGIWHSGSPMASIIHLLRGLYLLVPRNMTQAAGFYNTLLQSDNPGIIIEVLNGYRLKERLPDNIGEFTVPLGVPEILRSGRDVTIVTYGACCRIVLEASELLSQCQIDAEVVDVQSLLPFDLPQTLLASLQKTNRIVFVDEDMPGGATAYMMQEVLEKQGGYKWLDSEPRTVSGKPHRPAYGSDGDYFSKPNVEEIFEAVYDLMHESDPDKYPIFYR
ncbi:MAG: thiamine pyrophosphate-dependent enzyme [bacterium]